MIKFVMRNVLDLPCRHLLDDDGMVVDEIEDAYEKALADSGHPPKFIYVLPNFHNPGGTTQRWGVAAKFTSRPSVDLSTINNLFDHP